MIPKFVTAMLAGRSPTVHGDGRQSRDFTFVDNVVQANLAAAAAPDAPGGVFNAACGRQYSLLDLIGLVNHIFRRRDQTAIHGGACR